MIFFGKKFVKLKGDLHYFARMSTTFHEFYSKTAKSEYELFLVKKIVKLKGDLHYFARMSTSFHEFFFHFRTGIEFYRPSYKLSVTPSPDHIRRITFDR